MTQALRFPVGDSIPEMTLLVDRHSGIGFTSSHCRNFPEEMLIEPHMHRPLWASLSMTISEDLGPVSPLLLSYSLLYDTDMENRQWRLGHAEWTQHNQIHCPRQDRY